VSPEEAAIVFRRAAELEAAGVHGEPGMLDGDTLEAIGREVGLSPAAVRTALVELRAGGLREPDPSFDLVCSRLVPGFAVDVWPAVDELARGNLLGHPVRRGDATTWTRQRGVGRAVVRGLGGLGRYPLAGVRMLRATVTEHGARQGRLRVRLEARWASPFQIVPLRTQAVLTAGLGGGLWAAASLDGTGAVVSAAVAGVGVLWSGVALRKYRHAIVTAEQHLQVFLDRLQHGPAVQARVQVTAGDPSATANS
jgi:hypothetical protein